MSSERAGSPKYMSPEQIRGDVTLDGRSDVFSLGTVLYEMLTGKPPFAGETVTEIMQAVLEHTPPVPSVVDAHVPPELDGVVMRMLAKRPDDRYPSARSLFRELRRVDENFSARAEQTPAVAAPIEPDALVPVPARGPVGAGDETLVIGTGPQRRVTWRRAAVLGAIAAAIAVIVMIPLKLQYNDANATRTAAPGAQPIVAAAPEPPPASRTRPRAEPPAAASVPPEPPKKAAAPRRAQGGPAASGRRRPASGAGTAARRGRRTAARPAAAADREAHAHGLAMGRGLRRRQAPGHRLAGRDDRDPARPASHRDPQPVPGDVPRQRDGPGGRHAADHPPVRLSRSPRAPAAGAQGATDWRRFRLLDDGSLEPVH